jgi:hypothetical protein
MHGPVAAGGRVCSSFRPDACAPNITLSVSDTVATLGATLGSSSWTNNVLATRPPARLDGTLAVGFRIAASGASTPPNIMCGWALPTLSPTTQNAYTGNGYFVYCNNGSLFPAQTDGFGGSSGGLGSPVNVGSTLCLIYNPQHGTISGRMLLPGASVSSAESQSTAMVLFRNVGSNLVPAVLMHDAGACVVLTQD